ncbi:hypothetical protein KUTeg_010154 [Tegillarca granosa]|uniref:RING-type domain-containing protein n=1 Tax=Tegillarca granosa TaxID=220873 RepID=A0ABQ9F868_TEGGR|nr:hypothetical protein KUTeg_010154 [Tegillarca granosa]
MFALLHIPREFICERWTTLQQMAESVGIEDTHLNSCPICLETFKTPRTLSCLHTFCQTCLSSLYNFLFETKRKCIWVRMPRVQGCYCRYLLTLM